MYRKTPFKRLMKRLPVSSGLMAKLSPFDDDGMTIEGEAYEVQDADEGRAPEVKTTARRQQTRAAAKPTAPAPAAAPETAAAPAAQSVEEAEAEDDDGDLVVNANRASKAAANEQQAAPSQSREQEADDPF